MVHMESQARQTAVKTRIINLLNGKYVVNEGWEPNHVLWNNQKISRVNIIGVVVEKSQNEFSSNTSATIDDGSGRINVRSFEENLFLNSIAVGDVVVLIGRPREYSNEIYVMPEIIKPLEDRRWAEVRKLELGPEEKESPANAIRTEDRATFKIAEPREQIRKEIHTAEKENDESEVSGNQDGGNEAYGNEMTSTRIINMIKEKDSGSGVDFEAVLSSANDKRAEEIIQNLLKSGDIFELRPGKLKVL